MLYDEELHYSALSTSMLIQQNSCVMASSLFQPWLFPEIHFWNVKLLRVSLQQRETSDRLT